MPYTDSKDVMITANGEEPVIPRSSIEQFLAVLSAEPSVNSEFSMHVKRAASLFDADTDTGTKPFLTVLVRTQARRIEALQDALLCLSAQTSSDFEVIVLAHNVAETEFAIVEQLVSNQVRKFRDRVKVVAVEGGGRARPLNVGIDEARGRYLAVFDDDDLLFGNWVQAFAEAAPVAHNRMLRANVATQRVSPEIWSAGSPGYRSKNWPKAEYARTFDHFTHLKVNHSPFMSWAFPTALFTTIGVRFDETLEVCEDWDVIVRGSFLMGVVDVPALTSIYRRWEGGASSYSEHSASEWRRSEAAVVGKLDGVPLLFPAGTAARVRADDIGISSADLREQLHQIHISRSWRMLARIQHLLAPARRVASSIRSRVQKR